MWLDKVNYKINSYTKIADRLKILLNQLYFVEKMAYFKVRNEIREYREKAHPNESFSHEIPSSLDILTKKLERVMDNMIYFSAKNRDDILQKPYNTQYFSIERDLAELVKNHNNMIDFSKIDYYLSEESSIPYNAHIKPDCRTIFICPKLRKEFEQQATDISKRISKL
jgi:hypothetical protein